MRNFVSFDSIGQLVCRAADGEDSARFFKSKKAIYTIQTRIEIWHMAIVCVRQGCKKLMLHHFKKFWRAYFLNKKEYLTPLRRWQWQWQWPWPKLESKIAMSAQFLTLAQTQNLNFSLACWLVLTTSFPKKYYYCSKGSPSSPKWMNFWKTNWRGGEGGGSFSENSSILGKTGFPKWKQWTCENPQRWHHRKWNV